MERIGKMKSYPIDSHVTYDADGIPEFDRAITSEPLRKLLKSLFKTGIDPTVSTNLQVTADEGMNVLVRGGFAIVEGCMALEEETRTMVVQASSTEYDRIDTVVLRLNDNDNVRECDLYVVEGTPSQSPVHPDLTRSGAIYEIGLADIFVGKNSTRILADKITDTRFDVDRCGVMSSISEFDTTTLNQQMNAWGVTARAEFAEWVETTKNILNESTAGNLLNMIEELESSVNDDISQINAQLTAKADATALNELSQSVNTQVTNLSAADVKSATLSGNTLYLKNKNGANICSVNLGTLSISAIKQTSKGTASVYTSEGSGIVTTRKYVEVGHSINWNKSFVQLNSADTHGTCELESTSSTGFTIKWENNRYGGGGGAWTNTASWQLVEYV